MKTKIISFIFLMAFMTIAINCKPDPIPSRPSHKYTIEEIKQIRENLIGTYRGVIDGQDALLEIEANRHFLFIINGRILSSGNYTMNFFLDNTITLMFGHEHEYRMDFTPNSYTQVIGLRPVKNPSSYLHKIRNNEL